MYMMRLKLVSEVQLTYNRLGIVAIAKERVFSCVWVG